MRKRAALTAFGVLAGACFTDVGDLEPAAGGAAGAGTAGAAGVGASGGSSAGGGAGVGAAAGDGGGSGCAGTVADCDANPDNGCETDLTASTEHCGACGHDCLGKPCSAGVCEPIVLATAQDQGYAIAVDGPTLFWSRETGSVLAGSTDGAQPSVLATGLSFADLGIDDDAIYWVGYSEGALRRMDKQGGGSVVVLGGMTDPVDLFVDPSGVFVSDAKGGQIQFVAKDGTKAQLVADALNLPRGLAADATHVYFTSGDGAVRRVVRGGGKPEIFAPVAAGFYGRALLLDATHVYWRVGETGDFIGAEGHVYRVAKTGGTPESLADHEPGPRDMTADSTRLYWTNLVNGTISRVGKDGTGALLLAKGQQAPHGIAVDDTAVYWINWVGGQLLKTGK